MLSENALERVNSNIYYTEIKPVSCLWKVLYNDIIICNFWIQSRLTGLYLPGLVSTDLYVTLPLEVHWFSACRYSRFLCLLTCGRSLFLICLVCPSFLLRVLTPSWPTSRQLAVKCIAVYPTHLPFTIRNSFVDFTYMNFNLSYTTPLRKTTLIM